MPQFEYDYAGVQLFTLTSTDLQTALVQQILSAAQAAPALTQVLYAPAPGSGQSSGTVAVTLPIFLEFQYLSGPDRAAGSAATPSVQVLMDAAGASYATGSIGLSTVVAGDDINATIINNNPNGALLAVTGATQSFNGYFFSSNTLEGLTGVNQFITGSGGRDAVVLDGVVNTLTSNGYDVVLVGGPSTVTAAAGGTDLITMTNGTVLAFANGSSSSTVDSVTGAANAIILLAGSGNTALTSGVGTEYDFVDTSAGNVTLTGNAAGVDLFTFVKDQTNATANIQVNGFTSTDGVAIHGYTGFSVAALAPTKTYTGGALLSLSDGSTITFNGTAAGTIQAAVKLV